MHVLGETRLLVQKTPRLGKRPHGIEVVELDMRRNRGGRPIIICDPSEKRLRGAIAPLRAEVDQVDGLVGNHHHAIEREGDHHVIGIEESDPLPSSGSDTYVPGSATTMVALMDNGQAGISVSQGIQDGTASVGRPIIDADDLE